MYYWQASKQQAARELISPNKAIMRFRCRLATVASDAGDGGGVDAMRSVLDLGRRLPSRPSCTGETIASLGGTDILWVGVEDDMDK